MLTFYMSMSVCAPHVCWCVTVYCALCAHRHTHMQVSLPCAYVGECVSSEREEGGEGGGIHLSQSNFWR